MTEIPTEREALLEARVKELEAAAAQRKTAGAGAGVVEQVWHYFTAFVPSWIIACGLAIFLGFHAWEYINKAQMATAETQLQKSQAALKDANARAQADLIEAAGQTVPLQTEVAKAEAEKAKQEAAQAQIEADAVNAKIGNETARLATARAELANKQAQAQKARAEADAKTTMSGLLTLEQFAERLKLKQTKLEGINSRAAGAVASAPSLSLRQMVNGRSINSAQLFVEGACSDNEYAREMGCPARYVRQQEEREVRAAQPAEQATGTNQPLAAGQFAKVTSPELNFRKCPKPDDRECPALHLPNGMRVKIIEPVENGWVKIEVDHPYFALFEQTLGYVNGKFLKPE
jgi:hypothetical protein